MAERKYPDISKSLLRAGALVASYILFPAINTALIHRWYPVIKVPKMDALSIIAYTAFDIAKIAATIAFYSNGLVPAMLFFAACHFGETFAIARTYLTKKK